MLHSEPPHYYLIQMWQHQLQKEYDAINWRFKLKLARPQFKIVNVVGFLGQWDPLLREMKFSHTLIHSHSWPIVLEILKHEIAHQLVTDRGYNETGHGPIFKKFCQDLSVDPRFQRAQSEIPMNEIDFESAKNLASTARDIDPEGQRLMEKIEKLLSLAQSNHQNEAVAAMEKVNELYEKYNIQRIQKKSDLHHYHYLIINLKSSKTKIQYSIISSILTEHYFVEVIHSDVYEPLTNRRFNTLEIFGTKENLLIAEYIFHFLNRTVEELWLQYARLHQQKGKHKRSFQLGLLHGFDAKLRSSKTTRRTNLTDPETTKALAKLEEDPALSLFIARKYPNLSRKKRGSNRVYGSTFEQGLADGKHIIIHKGLEKSGPSNGGGSLLGFSKKLFLSVEKLP